MKNRGSVLVEILTVAVLFVMLVVLSLQAVGRIMEKARILSAKAQLAQFALLLEAVKDDTGLYPRFLSDLLFSPAPPLQSKGWTGPYLQQLPFDPWGHPYYYKIPPTTLFSSPALPREHGKPETASFTIETAAGAAVLRIENHGITACSVWLNGVEVVRENEFNNHPNPQIIEKNVTLLAVNTLEVRARSKPGEEMYAALSGFIPTMEYFIVGSYGKDGGAGGQGVNTDIEWVSNIYPHFR